MRTIWTGLSFAVLASAGACTSSGSVPEIDCTQPGMACRWAGTGEKGFNKGAAVDRMDSRVDFPQDLTFGPDGRAYVADWNNHLIRRVELDGTMTVAIGTDYEGDGAPGMPDMLPFCNPIGAPATTVAQNHPTDLEFGPDGRLYVASWHNNKIRIYDPSTEIVTVLAGNSYGYTGDGSSACYASFNQPKAVEIAADGTLYTIDQRNVRIRKLSIDPTAPITAFAGTGSVGDAGDGGLATDAQFGFEAGTTPRPSGALELGGNYLYIADSLNNRIRRIDLTTNMIDCIAGNAAAGYSGDGGQALLAQLNFPMDLELGPDGRLYVADRYNHVIRAIDLTTGVIETVVGNGSSCESEDGTCPDGALALQMPLQEPYGIAFDAEGSLYVADTHNNRILKVVR